MQSSVSFRNCKYVNGPLAWGQSYKTVDTLSDSGSNTDCYFTLKFQGNKRGKYWQGQGTVNRISCLYYLM